MVATALVCNKCCQRCWTVRSAEFMAELQVADIDEVPTRAGDLKRNDTVVVWTFAGKGIGVLGDGCGHVTNCIVFT